MPLKLNKDKIVSLVLKVFINLNVFNELKIHQLNNFPNNSSHLVDLIRATSQKYNIRIKYNLNMFNNCRTTKRQLLNKAVLFNGQKYFIIYVIN